MAIVGIESGDAADMHSRLHQANCCLHGIPLTGAARLAARQDAAHSLCTDASTLVTLAGDVDPYVREGVSTNPNTPTDVLEVLSRDTALAVRRGVALNPSAPASALVRLSDDPGFLVRKGATQTIAGRICERFGIHPSDVAPIDLLRDQEWWAMTPDDPAVDLALALAPNV